MLFPAVQCLLVFCSCTVPLTAGIAPCAFPLYYSLLMKNTIACATANTINLPRTKSRSQPLPLKSLFYRFLVLKFKCILNKGMKWYFRFRFTHCSNLEEVCLKRKRKGRNSFFYHCIDYFDQIVHCLHAYKIASTLS